MLTGNLALEILAPQRDVFARLADIERYPEWQSFVTSVVVASRDGDGRPQVVEARLDAKATQLRATLRYAYAEPGRVAWTYDGGDVKDLCGSFDLAPTAAGTMVTMDVAVDPGFKLGLLLRGPVEDRVRASVLDGTLSGLAASFSA